MLHDLDAIHSQRDQFARALIRADVADDEVVDFVERVDLTPLEAFGVNTPEDKATLERWLEKEKA